MELREPWSLSRNGYLQTPPRTLRLNCSKRSNLLTCTQISLFTWARQSADSSPTGRGSPNLANKTDATHSRSNSVGCTYGMSCKDGVAAGHRRFCPFTQSRASHSLRFYIYTGPGYRPTNSIIQPVSSFLAQSIARQSWIILATQARLYGMPSASVESRSQIHTQAV